MNHSNKLRFSKLIFSGTMEYILKDEFKKSNRKRLFGCNTSQIATEKSNEIGGLWLLSETYSEKYIVATDFYFSVVDVFCFLG